MNEPKPSYDDMLLFSVDGSGRAVEVTSRGFEFDESITPLFENSKVLKPVPVMVEGEYHIFDQLARAWKKVSISADDIKAYLENTPRDVAINYEHKREGPPKGWLRIKDTAKVGMLQTKRGLKTALFAAIELFEDAAQDVRKGLFRDVSIELKPVSREILGTALTGYPIMRDVQFYSNDVVATDPVHSDTSGSEGEAREPAVVSEASNSAERVAEAEAIASGAEHAFAESDTVSVPAHLSDPSSDPTSHSPQETDMTDIDKNAILAEALQEYGLKPEDLGDLKDALAVVRKQEQDLRFANAREHVKSLSRDDKGNLKLTPASLDAAAQLYAFCQENETLQFSIGEQELNPAQLFDELMKGIQGVQVFGAITDEETGAPVADVVADVPTTDTETPVNTDNVRSLVARMKSQMQSQGLV